MNEAPSSNNHSIVYSIGRPQMDYDKITKYSPQGSGGGGLSPAKLRNMLKRKKKQGEDELESTFYLGSQVSEVDDSGDCLENYKDVDVVSVLPKHTPDTLLQGADNDNRSKDHPSLSSKIEAHDDGDLDYESGINKGIGRRSYTVRVGGTS